MKIPWKIKCSYLNKNEIPWKIKLSYLTNYENIQKNEVVKFIYLNKDEYTLKNKV